MRIGIDARMMTPEATRGIGRYIEELIRAMLKIAPQHRYVLVTRQAIHPFSSHPSVETVVADIPWYGLAEQIRMPGVLRNLKADVVHIPHWNVPRIVPQPLVVTIHDLLLRHEPVSARISTRNPLVARVKRFGYRVTLVHALRKAQAILVPTRFVADDVMSFYPWTATKVTVTGEGMSHYEPYPKKEFRQPPASMYLLYVGSAYPHKGLDFLIDVWSELEEAYPDLHLKIAGGQDAFMRQLELDVQRRNLSRVEFLGFVPDEELRELQAEAVAFVYPSRFEGFGLPPLEALQAGCPVIAARAGALVEVLGIEGVFFFQPGSKTGILQAIEEVLQNPEVARQRVERALPVLRKKHDWLLAAQRTLDVYTSLF